MPSVEVPTVNQVFDRWPRHGSAGGGGGGEAEAGLGPEGVSGMVIISAAEGSDDCPPSSVLTTVT